ncbi:MAG: choice-of-anchor tandem repeat NxxGxxAF-containing protein, partial [Chthoniobacteraceae bacterium]
AEMQTGVPVFLGTFASPTGTRPASLVQTGVFGFGGATSLLVKTGDAAAETQGATFLNFRDPIGNGGTAFTGTLLRGSGVPKVTAADERGLWSNAFADPDGALHLVARVGTAAPGGSDRYASIQDIALNDGHHLFWTATLTGPVAKKNALFTQSSLQAPAEIVLRAGQTLAPRAVVRSFAALHSGGTLGDNLPGGSAGFGSGRPNGGATTPVRVTFTDSTVAVVNAGSGVLDLIARTNEAPPDFHGLWKTLGLPSAGGSAIAFRATLKPLPGSKDVTTKNAGVLYAKSEDQALTRIARQGELAPGFAPLTYGAFSDPILNAAGDILYFAQLAGPGVTVANREVLYVALHDSGGSVIVQRTGEEAPELPGILVAAFTGAALPRCADPNDPRGPVFTAKLQSGDVAVKTTNNSGLFAVDSTGALRLLARTGEQVNGKTLKTVDAFSYVLGSPVQARTAAASPEVIYRATFTDRSQALVKVPVP